MEFYQMLCGNWSFESMPGGHRFPYRTEANPDCERRVDGTAPSCGRVSQYLSGQGRLVYLPVRQAGSSKDFQS